MKDLCADRYGPLQGPLTADLVERNRDKITKFLKGLKVVFQLPNKPTTRRTVGVNGLDKAADKAVFSLDNGQQTNVATYFAGSKGYKLQRPDLPCLWVGSRNKHVLLPPEVSTRISDEFNYKIMFMTNHLNFVNIAVYNCCWTGYEQEIKR